VVSQIGVSQNFSQSQRGILKMPRCDWLKVWRTPIWLTTKMI
jgi:hypothetical protein